MNARQVVLGVWLAALPIAVDLPGPRDSSRTGPLRVEVAGGGGQFAIVSRGCEGEVLRVTRNQLRSGVLVVEHRLPRDFVVGVRGGSVQTTLNTGTQVRDPAQAFPEAARQRVSNRYVNPYLGYEGRRGGVGVGVLMADLPFEADHAPSLSGDFPQPAHAHSLRERSTTWHARVGGDRQWLTVRWMEDVPLESEGHFSADLGLRVSRQLETGVFVGLAGPYDGAMFGLRGRVWFTPGAAFQIKASTAGGGHGEYGVYGSVTARLPGVH